MIWFRKKGKVQREVAVARAERKKSEERLADAQRTVIMPLAELRKKNHIGETLETLIQRRVDNPRGGA